MSETTYYRSTHPAVRAWHEEAQRRHGAYIEQAKALGAEFPDHEVIERCFLGNRQVFGLDGETAPGPEWVQKNGDSYWSPSRRSRAGKALAERLKTLHFRMPGAPGMPADVFVAAESRCVSPGFLPHGDTYFAFTEAPAELVESDPAFDPAIWQRCKASEYHLAREAEEVESEAAG
jgi:hypothetical protein